MAKDNITSYKNQLLTEIVKNERIVEAIDSSIDGYIKSQNDTLIGKNVFPMLRVPEIQEKAAVYIGTEVDITGVNSHNPTYHNWLITIWVMAHRDKIYWRDRGCNRIDYISDELKKMLQDSTKYGFGLLNLTSNKTHLLNPKYSYRELIFKTCDLKQSVCNKFGHSHE